jgi:hypothetical protein
VQNDLTAAKTFPCERLAEGESPCALVLPCWAPAACARQGKSCSDAAVRWRPAFVACAPSGCFCRAHPRRQQSCQHRHPAAASLRHLQTPATPARQLKYLAAQLRAIPAWRAHTKAHRRPRPRPAPGSRRRRRFPACRLAPAWGSRPARSKIGCRTGCRSFGACFPRQSSCYLAFVHPRQAVRRARQLRAFLLRLAARRSTRPLGSTTRNW